MSIYEGYYDTMIQIMEHIAHQLEANSRRYEAEHGDKLYEHLNYRIKGDNSMRDKLAKRGLAPTAYNALRKVKDSIGLRVVCLFIDDVYENASLLKSLPGCSVVQEKDFIKDAKPNGYRSYHLILDVTADAPDVDGNTPGHYYVEIQLRTIANPELITRELHRCANELASCDVSMQTLKKIIRNL